MEVDRRRRQVLARRPQSGRRRAPSRPRSSCSAPAADHAAHQSAQLLHRRRDPLEVRHRDPVGGEPRRPVRDRRRDAFVHEHSSDSGPASSGRPCNRVQPAAVSGSCQRRRPPRRAPARRRRPLGEPPGPVPDAELAARRERLLDEADRLGLDAVLVHGANRSGSAVPWLTCWQVTREAVVVLRRGERPTSCSSASPTTCPTPAGSPATATSRASASRTADDRARRPARGGGRRATRRRRRPVPHRLCAALADGVELRRRLDQPYVAGCGCASRPTSWRCCGTRLR